MKDNAKRISEPDAQDNVATEILTSFLLSSSPFCCSLWGKKKDSHLNVEQIKGGLHEALEECQMQPLAVNWMMRYSVVDTTRSVVDNLGYVVSVTRIPTTACC